MKPVWAALGIILLLSSIFIVVGASLNFERTYVSWDEDPNPGDMYSSWNVSRVLNESDFFKVEIYAAQDWNQYMEPAGVYAVPFKASFVNITDPSGRQTEFDCDFLRLSTDTSKALVFYNLTGTGANETIEPHGIDQISFEIPYGDNKPGIVARALSSGNYTASMTWLEGGGSAPLEMKLTRGVMVDAKVSYSYFYPVGLGVFLVSAVLLVYGFRKPRKSAPRKRTNVR